MTGAPTPSVALADVLGGDSQPRLAIDLDTLAVVGANQAAYVLLGGDPPSLEGTAVIDVVVTGERPAVEASVRLLASGAIDGYRAVRRLQKADGSELTASVWAQMTTIGGTRMALATIEGDSTGLSWPMPDASTRMALAVTDHDWVIEHASSDTEGILGLGPEAYEGSSLLSLLRPADVQGFMGAVGRVAAGGGAATLRVHIRTEKGRWQDVYCVVVAMCRHSPPRLGLALAVIAEPGGEMSLDTCRQVAERGVDALSSIEQFRSRLPPGNFSMRQWEILSRLVHGERVQDIADALYLSPSTVRNHLTAIYRKFGVHSQAELLATLLNVPPLTAST